MYKKLKEIIYKKAHLNHYNSSQNSFYIKENDANAKCRRIDLLQFESEDVTFGFKLDLKKINKISQYFENGQGADKGNDAIIFTTIKGQQYVFICELKDGGRGYIAQFKSSSCFVDYLNSILKRIYGIDANKVIFKYILFSSKGRSGSTTRGKPVSSEQDGLDVYHMRCDRSPYYITSFI